MLVSNWAQNYWAVSIVAKKTLYDYKNVFGRVVEPCIQSKYLNQVPLDEKISCWLQVSLQRRDTFWVVYYDYLFGFFLGMVMIKKEIKATRIIKYKTISKSHLTSGREFSCEKRLPATSPSDRCKQSDQIETL